MFPGVLKIDLVVTKFSNKSFDLVTKKMDWIISYNEPLKMLFTNGSWETFWLQRQDNMEALEWLQKLLMDSENEVEKEFKEGHILRIYSKDDGCFYRGRIEALDPDFDVQRISQKVKVLYIDYGTSEMVNTKYIFKVIFFSFMFFVIFGNFLFDSDEL